MEKKECTIAFTGDIGFDRYMDGRWRADDLLSAPVLEFLRGADHVVANVEGALTDARDDGSRGVFFHSMNPEAISVLERIRADIWNISNNHIMDAGEQGLISSCTYAEKHGCKTIGAGRNEREASEPVYLSEAGGIGLFGVAYMKECIPATETEPGVFRWDDTERIAARIREVKARCRWCIVVAHGGEEFADLPNPYTRERYLSYLALGADIVVAHHPHVPENYELLPDGKAVFYSLGNFIFDTDYQRAHPYTDTGVLLKLRLTETNMEFSALGTHIVRGTETVEEGPLPGIFTDVPAEEYERLAPLSAKVFLAEERAKMCYLEPDRFGSGDESVWKSYCFSEEPDGYDKGKHMDLSLIVPLAEQAAEGAWRDSSLACVKKYLLERPVLR